MPKLSKEKQKKVDEAEGSSFPVLPTGRYVATLKEVNADKNGQPLVGKKSGVPYWQWVFEELTLLHDAVYTDRTDPKNPVEHPYTAGHVFPGRQFVNTSLSDDAAWKFKEVFEAFGYGTDSDTDEMVGEKVILHVTVRPIEGGDRDGEDGNNVGRVAPYSDDGTDDGWDAE